MTPETAKRLHDVRGTCAEIEQFISGVDEAGFHSNRQLHLAAHKLLEIIAEALNATRRSDSGTAQTIPNFRRYIDLRNQITHNYDDVNYRIVWRVAKQEVPRLKLHVDNLLADDPST